MLDKRKLCITLSLILFSWYTASAVQLNPGNVKLSVAGILLDVESAINILDQISFGSSSFTARLSGGQLLKISSSDRRAFTVSNSDYVTTECTDTKSILTITMPSSSAQRIYTITPQSTTCTSGGGGGGAGGAGAGAAPAPAPTPAPAPAPAPAPTPAPAPAPAPAPEPTPTPTPTPEPTPTPTPAPGPTPAPTLTAEQTAEVVAMTEAAGIDTSTASTDTLAAVVQAVEATGEQVATTDAEVLGTTIQTVDQVNIDLATVESTVIQEVLQAVEEAKLEGLDLAANQEEVFQRVMEVFEAATPVTFGNTAQAVQTISSGGAAAVAAVTGGAAQIFQGVTTGSSGSGLIVSGTENTGEYEWNTSQPLASELGVAPLKLTAGSGYQITVISAVDASIQDISDAPFNLVLAGTPIGSLLNEKLSLLSPFWQLLSVANAQETAKPSIKIIYPNGGESLVLGQTYGVKWEYQNLSSSHPVNISVKKDFKFADTVKNVNTEVQKTVKQLRSTPVVTKTVKRVTAPAATAVSAATAGTIAVTASTSSANIAINLSQLVQSLELSKFYLFAFIRFKKRKPWGRTVDKLNGKPIAGATIQIFDAAFKKMKDSQVTDKDGRFGALAGLGKYYIKVSKAGYQPLQSEVLTITDPNQILNLEFSLSPILEEFSLEYLRRINVLNAVKKFVETINPYLLAFGTIVSAVSLAIIPSTLNYFTLFVYVFFDALKIYFTFQLLKPFGKVTDETTSQPLALAVVRIFDEEKNWLLATKATDEQGRFNFLLAPGKYYITCSKAGFAPFRSGSIILEKAGLPSLDIKMKITA